MKRLPWAVLLAGLSGCHRYADFTLPRTAGGDAAWPIFTEAAAPVISNERTSDVLNPSVVRKDGSLYNFYSEYDGHTWHTALASSVDGMNWQGTRRVLSPDPHTWEGAYIAANGTAYYAGGKWFYWYVSGPGSRPQIGLATGQDPANLTKEPLPVLSAGPRGSFDEFGAADPYVIRVKDFWYMFYLGQSRARLQQIGLARSPDGVVWTKFRGSPVLTMDQPGGMDDRGLGEPAVWEANGWYWMLFTGRDAHENRTLGLARSTDGVRWTRSPQVIHGAHPWDSRVLCDPTVLAEGPHIRVWFGGGDIPSPDQNLHGQIGVGELR